VLHEAADHKEYNVLEITTDLLVGVASHRSNGADPYCLTADMPVVPAWLYK
jgi:hypothetical protein